MTKPMKYIALARLLTQAGFTRRQGKGDHEVWRNGNIVVVITHTKLVSPKVTKDALKAIERSREWHNSR
ncbi:putative RNA binding protein YcfA (HicA-like mRNA interferase family) [Arcanobacterium wilhelmae]|uniref:RNA binding protein YcfA (HicA-like mRNA interferase family) n=1 Tax=Arcanobacterium wilhelmae TaxID=1803177 RepID=A0ABT9NCB7_9ACTO|nr:type II toxin-antitoxin system HicA family toxin [Arcanobacterium wilhelmae]MDP9801135.1 putative RNA binding protein YcfA (HicA-like mRNA interferase family) [Arcanobacterium wilhelmae]WFN90488.1 type II toxin-antitoxin system HicA family toxin [Arcanobacterium wilhelmae]